MVCVLYAFPILEPVSRILPLSGANIHLIRSRYSVSVSPLPQRHSGGIKSKVFEDFYYITRGASGGSSGCTLLVPEGRGSQR